MNEIVNNIQSPAWWICVVVVSFIVNILAGYAKPICDHIGASMSVRLRNKLKKEEAEFEKDVEAILASQDGVTLVSLEEIRAVVFAMFFMAFAILGNLAIPLFDLFGWQSIMRVLCDTLTMISAFIGLRYLGISQGKARLLKAAQARRKDSSMNEQNASTTGAASQ